MSFVHSVPSLWSEPTTARSNLKSEIRNPNVDGGYAWIVVLAVFCGNVFIYGIAWTQGVFYMVFLEEFGESPSKTAWIGTISTTCNFLGGPVGSILSNRFGARVAISIGTAIATFGLALNFFASTSISFLFVTFAIAGFGLGINFVPMTNTLCDYFQRYRNMAMGLSLAGVGFGTFIYPPFIRVLIASYDWKGALLVMSAVNLNFLIVAVVLKPLTCYPNFQSPEQTEEMALESSSVTGREIDIPDDERTLSWMEILQLDVLANADYMCLMGNVLLTLFAYSIVYTHIANYTMSLNFSIERCTMILSAIGISNLVGRVLFGFLGQHPNMNVIGLYAVTAVASGFITALIPMLRYYPGLLILAGLFGFLTAAVGVLIAEVLVLTVGLRRLSGGYGYNLIGQAFGYLLGGPVAGFMIEAHGTYGGTFYLAGGCLLLSGACMILPWHRSTRPWDLSKLEVDRDFHGFGTGQNTNFITSRTKASSEV